MAMIACKSKSKYTIKQGKIRKEHDFAHPRFWIEVLKHYVLRHLSSLKKFRAFLPESVFSHFRSYALKIGIIRDFGHHWKMRVAGTFWFSEALGSAEPVAFQKRPLGTQHASFHLGGGWGCIKFAPRAHILDLLSTFCASFFLLFSPSPPSPSFLNPSPSSDLKTPPFPRGNAIFRGWGAARVVEGVTMQKKEGISF